MNYIEILRDEVVPLIDPDALGPAADRRCPLQRLDNVGAAVALAEVERLRQLGVNIHDRQDADLRIVEELIDNKFI